MIPIIKSTKANDDLILHKIKKNYLHCSPGYSLVVGPDTFLGLTELMESQRLAIIRNHKLAIDGLRSSPETNKRWHRWRKNTATHLLLTLDINEDTTPNIMGVSLDRIDDCAKSFLKQVCLEYCCDLSFISRNIESSGYSFQALITNYNTDLLRAHRFGIRQITLMQHFASACFFVMPRSNQTVNQPAKQSGNMSFKLQRVG